jgi:hypothetical protein
LNLGDLGDHLNHHIIADLNLNKQTPWTWSSLETPGFGNEPNSTNVWLIAGDLWFCQGTHNEQKFNLSLEKRKIGILDSRLEFLFCRLQWVLISNELDYPSNYRIPIDQDQ